MSGGVFDNILVESILTSGTGMEPIETSGESKDLSIAIVTSVGDFTVAMETSGGDFTGEWVNALK